MSTKGVYSALSGAMAQSLKLDTIANNLANVNTPGFKKDQQLFQEYLTTYEKPTEVMPIPRDVAAIESFYNFQGGDKSFVDSKGTFTDFSQGSLKKTGNPLDVGIDGKGFFEVATPQGVRLTRAGHFTLDGNGQLVTQQGYPVLKTAEPGADPASRVINIGQGGGVSISDSGEVMQGDQVVAKLSLVDVANPDSLQKIGTSLYGFKNNMAPQISILSNPSLKQGFMEGSNVNIVEEMTEMIKTQRVFESTQKAISAYDSMAEKLVNVVGKTGQ
ncbi:MAG: flagellar basal-body rod protein FlgF [Pseudobdellovibrionaceae bacterium]